MFNDRGNFQADVATGFLAFDPRAVTDEAADLAAHHHRGGEVVGAVWEVDRRGPRIDRLLDGIAVIEAVVGHRPGRHDAGPSAGIGLMMFRRFLDRQAERGPRPTQR